MPVESERADLFEKRDLIDEILHPSERAEPAADPPPEREPEQQQEPKHIERKRGLFVRSAHRGLKRTDRTRADRRRAGIAVQPRHADGLRFAHLDRAEEEMMQLRVLQQKGGRLHGKPLPLALYTFCLSQYRYTPCRSESLFSIRFPPVPRKPRTAEKPCPQVRAR